MIKLLKKYGIMFTTMVFLLALSVSYGKNTIAHTSLELHVTNNPLDIGFTKPKVELKDNTVSPEGVQKGDDSMNVTSNSISMQRYHARIENMALTKGNETMQVKAQFCLHSEKNCSNDYVMPNSSNVGEVDFDFSKGKSVYNVNFASTKYTYQYNRGAYDGVIVFTFIAR